MIRVSLIALLCLAACGRIGYSSQGGEFGDGGVVIDLGDAGACNDVEPFDPRPADLAALVDAVQAFNDACAGRWCEIREPVAYTYSACAQEPTLELAVETGLSELQLQIQASFEWGQVIDSAAVINTDPLSLQSAEAGAILEQLAVITGGDVTEAWSYEEEVPCQNCTEYGTVMVLWFRASRFIVALPGGHGFDS